MPDPVPKDGPIIVRRIQPQGVALPPPPELTGQSPDNSNLRAPVQVSRENGTAPLWHFLSLG